MPIANARLYPVSDDAFSQTEGLAEAGQFSVANPDAALVPKGAGIGLRAEVGNASFVLMDTDRKSVV